MNSNNKTKIKIAVIGGGASGMTAAIFASKNSLAEVTIFERNDICGKKLLSTGNGRANLTNEELTTLTSNNADFYFRGETNKAISLFSRFSYESIIDYLNSLGIYTHSKEGYVYPLSNQAYSVQKAFEHYISQKENISIIYNTKINNIKIDKDSVTLYWKKSDFCQFDKVIIATGGCAFPKSGSDGTGFYLLDKIDVPYNEMLPSLVELHTNELSFAAGSRCNVNLTLYNEEKSLSHTYSGELQINKNSLSGIVVFQVSGMAAKLINNGHKALLCIDFVPTLSNEMLKSVLISKKELYKTSGPEFLLTSIINERLINYFINISQLDKKTALEEISEEEISKLADLLKSYMINVDMYGNFDKAQCGTGGVSFEMLNDNLSLKMYPNIFVCGELINIDGICGGYNLSLAFCSGAIAGMEAINAQN